jgi:hypothetical protein
MISYRLLMHEMDFYFHEGCVSCQSILLLSKELQQECPTWRIAIHSLSEEQVKATGFHILPAIVISGATIAIGLPKKDWLLEKMKECERANR